MAMELVLKSGLGSEWYFLYIVLQKRLLFWLNIANNLSILKSWDLDADKWQSQDLGLQKMAGIMGTQDGNAYV